MIPDQIVGVQGVALRLITYFDPASRERFEFLSTEMTLPPGSIALLYRMRWDIEKVFDEIKNRIHEQKARATSATAKTMQARFIFVAHNPMTLLEAALAVEHSIRNTAEEARRRKRITQVRDTTRQAGAAPLPLACAKLAQLYASLCPLLWTPLLGTLGCHGEGEDATAIDLDTDRILTVGCHSGRCKEVGQPRRPIGDGKPGQKHHRTHRDHQLPHHIPLSRTSREVLP